MLLRPNPPPARKRSLSRYAAAILPRRLGDLPQPARRRAGRAGADRLGRGRSTWPPSPCRRQARRRRRRHRPGRAERTGRVPLLAALDADLATLQTALDHARPRRPQAAGARRCVNAQRLRRQRLAPAARPANRTCPGCVRPPRSSTSCPAGRGRAATTAARRPPCRRPSPRPRPCSARRGDLLPHLTPPGAGRAAVRLRPVGHACRPSTRRRSALAAAAQPYPPGVAAARPRVGR